MFLGRGGNLSIAVAPTTSYQILKIIPHPLTANYTEGEGKIYVTLFVRLCDLVAPLVLILRTRMRKVNLSIYILEIQNIFILLNNSLIRGVYN